MATTKQGLDWPFCFGPPELRGRQRGIAGLGDDVKQKLTRSPEADERRPDVGGQWRWWEQPQPRSASVRGTEEQKQEAEPWLLGRWQDESSSSAGGGSGFAAASQGLAAEQPLGLRAGVPSEGPQRMEAYVRKGMRLTG